MDSVIFTTNINEALNKMVELYSKVFVLTDTNTAQYCLPLVSLPTNKTSYFSFRAGEQSKNITTLEKIWQSMTKAGLDRHSLMINLGGGVTGDMGGFAAATYKRGIDFIQVPTTLLAQVDASVGGKLGIDFMGLKNQIGVFQTPKATIIDPIFLNSLDTKNMKSGFAEMLKHGFIHSKKHFHKLKQIDITNTNSETILPLIKESVAIKSYFVNHDPAEKNIRKALNFGHTFGHAMESYFLQRGDNVLHGEAVAQGMICELFLSNNILKFDFDLVLETIRYIRSIYPKIEIEPKEFNDIIGLLYQDKKNKDNQINFTLVSEIGSFEINQHCSKSLIDEALNFYFQFP